MLWVVSNHIFVILRCDYTPLEGGTLPADADYITIMQSDFFPIPINCYLGFKRFISFRL